MHSRCLLINIVLPSPCSTSPTSYFRIFPLYFSDHALTLKIYSSTSERLKNIPTTVPESWCSKSAILTLPQVPTSTFENSTVSGINAVKLAVSYFVKNQSLLPNPLHNISPYIFLSNIWWWSGFWSSLVLCFMSAPCDEWTLLLVWTRFFLAGGVVQPNFWQVTERDHLTKVSGTEAWKKLQDGIK